MFLCLYFILSPSPLQSKEECLHFTRQGLRAPRTSRFLTGFVCFPFIPHFLACLFVPSTPVIFLALTRAVIGLSTTLAIQHGTPFRHPIRDLALRITTKSKLFHTFYFLVLSIQARARDMFLEVSHKCVLISHEQFDILIYLQAQGSRLLKDVFNEGLEVICTRCTLASKINVSTDNTICPHCQK
mmetsp:Transcript_37497/g.76607  ORF Transcript_37497/g.76607 Transcript_37497/m.76607 type:complete len:185 (+) Transcript_37497:142-696(+)